MRILILSNRIQYADICMCPVPTPFTAFKIHKKMSLLNSQKKYFSNMYLNENFWRENSKMIS